MIRFTIAAFALLALASCAPSQNAGAEATVRSVYDVAQQNIGNAVTDADAIPMTDDLRDILARAEAAADARGEPFIEGDLALSCQDCVSISDLYVGPQTGAEREPAVEGHAWVEAKFKLNGDEDRRVLWDMAATPEGWRVDNIIHDGFDLRTEAQSYVATEPATAPAAP